MVLFSRKMHSISQIVSIFPQKQPHFVHLSLHYKIIQTLSLYINIMKVQLFSYVIYSFTQKLVSLGSLKILWNICLTTLHASMHVCVCAMFTYLGIFNSQKCKLCFRPHLTSTPYPDFSQLFF